MSIVHPTVVALQLTVIAGPDAGRSFRFAGVDRFEVRARSDPDDDGLALRTDPADGVRLRFARSGRRWTVVRVEGAELSVDGISCAARVLDGGASIEVGGTTMTATLSRAAIPSVAQAPSEARPEVEGFEATAAVSFGAAAQTWSARRVVDGLPVALKVARSGASAAIRRDFRREAEIASALAGVPHAAELVDARPDAASPWIAFRWIEGETLEERVSRDGPLALGSACAIARQLLDVLAAVHERGFVHRDVNPSNVMIEADATDAVPRATLIDFGLGKALDVPSLESTTNPTQTGEFLGRPRFLAPEQATDGKRAGPAADLYGAAATLYWALTRASHVRDEPSESTAAAWARGLLIPIRRRRRDVPEALAIALDQALARDPERRLRALLPLRTALASAQNAETTEK